MGKQKIKDIPKIIWGQTAYLFFVLYVLIGGVVSRHNDPTWAQMSDVRIKYDLFFGAGISALCLVVIVGLLSKKEWGRQLAISLNLVLIFINFGMRIGIFLYTKFAYGEGVVVVDSVAIILSVVSLFFLFVLMSDNVKSYYKLETING